MTRLRCGNLRGDNTPGHLGIAPWGWRRNQTEGVYRAVKQKSNGKSNVVGGCGPGGEMRRLLGLLCARVWTWVVKYA